VALSVDIPLSFAGGSPSTQNDNCPRSAPSGVLATCITVLLVTVSGWMRVDVAWSVPVTTARR
jgi:hypothetical protein